MTEIEIAREKVDKAIYEFMKACGVDADGVDYSYIDQELDDAVYWMDASSRCTEVSMTDATTIFFRKCDVCGRGMNQGYYDGDNIAGTGWEAGSIGKEYYCSDACLETEISVGKWNALYSENGESYYTVWEEAYPDDCVYTADGREVPQS